MAEIEAIIFDLGRVLVRIDFSRGLLAKLTAMAGEDGDQLIHRLVENDLFIEFNTGRLTPEAFYEQVTARLGLSVEFAEFCSLWCDIFHPQPGIEEMVRALQVSYKIGLLSDTDPLHWPYICKQFPFVATIQYPSLSYKLGMMKPSPEIFRMAAAATGCAPEACVFVDDLPRNVEGASAVGMDAIHFTDTPTLRKAFEARGLLGSPA